MASGNMYEGIPAQTWDLFSAYLDGKGSSLVCIVSARTLCHDARTALEKSIVALGYGEQVCTFVTLGPSDAADTSASDGEGTLDPAALFRLMEGLDPVCVIGADADAAKALGHAYRQDVPLDAPCRLFGRDAVSFRSFTSMLDDAQDKQVAWALLKKLPKWGKR